MAKLLYRQGADAFAVVGLRMAMAFPLFLLMAWWSSRGRPTEVGAQSPLSRKLGWQIVGLGFCGYYLASTLDFLGLQYISASLERLILYLNPTLVLLVGTTAMQWGARIDPFALMVVTLVAALPSASNVAVLSERFGADTGRIARIILLSTAAAFLTFSGFVALLRG